MKKKIALALAGIMMIAGLSGCGKDSGMSSPAGDSEQTQDITQEDTTAPEDTQEDTTAPEDTSDTETPDAEGEGGNTSGKTGSVGTFDGNTYTNDLFGFKIEVDGSTWKFYSNSEIASIAGVEEDNLNKLQSGEVSPYDQEISYCAVAYDSTTGTNIIINYFNPDKYGMPELTAKQYLDMGSTSYEGATVTETSFLGRTYAVMDLPQEEGTNYAQRMYAADQDGMIVMITLTVMSGQSVDEVASMLKTL